MNIIIAPDKFKGALSAVEVAQALKEGFLRAWPEAGIECLPIADGGEGTAEVLLKNLGGAWIQAECHNPIGHPIRGRYCWIDSADNGPLAVIEMSEASGLRRLKEHEKDPLRANTRGTGELILAAARRGAGKIIVGLGGSATNDGGVGMAAALGYRFLDDKGGELDPLPKNLLSLDRIQPPSSLDLPLILAAVDVQNPLLGPRGATRTFGPQKGATPKELDLLEQALERLAQVAAKDLGCDHRDTPGAGAAGGLGFGLLSFCRAEIGSGFDLIAGILHLEEKIAQCDLVLTAEGSMDAQTLEGKAPAGIARLARQQGKPVIAFAGGLSAEDRLQAVFDAICPLPNRPLGLEEAMSQSKQLLESAALRTARLLRVGGKLAGEKRS